MFRSALCWLSTAAASEVLLGKHIVKTCLLMASKSSLECRTELLRAAACLAKPDLIEAVFGSEDEEPRDNYVLSYKTECKILKVSHTAIEIGCCAQPIQQVIMANIAQSATALFKKNREPLMPHCE